jgi:hypothetical protein
VAVLFFGFAVGVATVVDEHGHGVAVDDDLAVAQSKEVGDGRVLVAEVGLLFGERVAGVFGDARAFADGGGGVAAGGVDGGRTDHQSHECAMLSLEGTYRGDEYGLSGGRVALPGDDLDPVRSPDDPIPAAGSGQQEDSSSSLSGLDKLLPKPDDDQADKKKKKEKEPTHQEAATEDINVGGYYLDKKNWKAAFSRFQSALVLDPENPEVYWGLAEAERQLGDLASARAHYEKVLEYDPDGPHGKQARKALKDPAIANAKKAAPRQPAVATP